MQISLAWLNDILSSEQWASLFITTSVYVSTVLEVSRYVPVQPELLFVPEFHTDTYQYGVGVAQSV
jgi:hypothetical protein